MNERRDKLAASDSLGPELNSQAPSATSPTSDIWSPKRLELLRWFQENAQPLAAAYEGAVRLLYDEDFPGRIHFVSHAVRDIADRLVFVLDQQSRWLQSVH